MRMFAIYCDNAVIAITATHEAVEWLFKLLMLNDRKQEHTWAIHPVSVSYEITE